MASYPFEYTWWLVGPSVVRLLMLLTKAPWTIGHMYIPSQSDLAGQEKLNKKFWYIRIMHTVQHYSLL